MDIEFLEFNCIENNDKIKLISISTLCFQSCPCRHDVFILYEDKRIVNSLISSSNLKNLYKYLVNSDIKKLKSYESHNKPKSKWMWKCRKLLCCV
jgi:hypothetical protein